MSVSLRVVDPYHSGQIMYLPPLFYAVCYQRQKAFPIPTLFRIHHEKQVVLHKKIIGFVEFVKNTCAYLHIGNIC